MPTPPRPPNRPALAPRTEASRAPTSLYTPAQRRRRDASPWTLWQAILAPAQFIVMLVSVYLVFRFLDQGVGYGIATLSVVVKTLLLYAIMVTGSLWERDVFGRYLFARPFFWEDVGSIVVLALHTLYLCGLLLGLWPERTLMWIAILAYATYTVNAGQFVLKLRAARRSSRPAAAGGTG